MTGVPTVDLPENSAAAVSEDPRRLEFEMRALEAEMSLREAINAEVGQRRSLRWWSVIVASFLMLLFITVLFWVLVNIPEYVDEELPTPLMLAMFVAPIVSLTTLSVALLIASFRGYKDGDESIVSSVASEGVKSAGIGS